MAPTIQAALRSVGNHVTLRIMVLCWLHVGRLEPQIPRISGEIHGEFLLLIQLVLFVVTIILGHLTLCSLFAYLLSPIQCWLIFRALFNWVFGSRSIFKIKNKFKKSNYIRLFGIDTRTKSLSRNVMTNGTNAEMRTERSVRRRSRSGE